MDSMTNIEKQEQNNRVRINFYIMRKMWQFIKGRAPKGQSQSTIYSAFNMARGQYTRAIDYGNIKLSQNKIHNLTLMTGLNADIFRGKKTFQINGLSETDWSEFLEERNDKQKTDRVKQKQIIQALETALQNDPENEDFSKLCYYLNNGRKMTYTPVSQLINESIVIIQKITFEHINQLSIAELKNYQDALKGQYELVTRVYHYKLLENKAKAQNTSNNNEIK